MFADRSVPTTVISTPGTRNVPERTMPYSLVGFSASWKSTPVVSSPLRTVTPDTVEVSNPAIVAVTAYVPDGRSGILYSPSTSVVAVTVTVPTLTETEAL